MANLVSTTLTGGFTEKKGTSSVSGTTLTVDAATGNYFEGDLASASGNIATFTISNPPSAGHKVGSFKIKIKQGTTARDFNWGSMTGMEPQWVDGNTPAMPTEYQTYTVYSFTTYDGGTTWYGQVVATAFDRDITSGPWGTRGIFAGGFSGPNPKNIIDYITISTPGNATDFGDITVARNTLAGCSSGSRGVFGGGVNASTKFDTTIDYITIASTGNATDFGDLTVGRYAIASCSSTTRGVFAGGQIQSGSTHTNIIDYITIASTGNATDFGDLTVARDYIGGTSSGTRGIFGGGSISGPSKNEIDYITIGSPGNATDFGDLSVTRKWTGAASDSIRAVWAGGDTYSTMDYVTIATPANALSFGQMSVASWNRSTGTSDGNRGVFGGGQNSPTTAAIDYIAISYASSGTDFGDLTVARDLAGACSGS